MNTTRSLFPFLSPFFPILSSSSWPIHLPGDPPSSSSTPAAGNAFLAGSRGGPAARRHGRSGEAANGVGERGGGGQGKGEGEEREAARVWGGWCLPPFLAGHYKAKWAKAQAQVAGKSQKTPFKLLFKRFSERNPLPIKYSLPIIYSLPVNSFRKLLGYYRFVVCKHKKRISTMIVA